MTMQTSGFRTYKQTRCTIILESFVALRFVSQVYKIRGGTIKQANRKFNTTSSEYEITFNRDSTFDIVADSEAPKVSYNFRKIEEIENTEPQSIVDVLAVVHDVQPLGSVTVKSGSNAGNQVRDVLFCVYWNDFMIRSQNVMCPCWTLEGKPSN